VCKLMDFGKYKYEAAVKAREARKNQTNTVLKEIRFRLKIDTHDYETKRGHALRFLGAGDKVKAMIQFRGREQQRPEMGIRLLQRFADDVAEVGVVESSPRIDGRNMVMVVGPLKNKAEAKAEARRATQRAEAKAENEAKAAGGRIDVSGDDQAPLTQSLADLLPEGFAINTEPEAVPEAPVQEAAPAVEPAAAAAPAKESVQEAPRQEAVKAAPKQEAPKQEAPRKEAPKAPAPKAAAPAPKAAAPAPKPVAEKPEAAKPAAAAPKPAGVPGPPKPVARPAAPKPAARPAPKAAPKPAGKKTT
jgi:translation initiation factor IF-3